MKVEIVDRQALVWSGDTGHLVVPSQEGAMGILPGHTPLMALLVPGRVEVNLSEGRSLVFEVDGGFVTDEDRAYVVVEHSDTGHTE